MKSAVTVLGASVLIGGAALAFADPGSAGANGQTPGRSPLDQMALNACADAFIGKLAHGGIVHSDTVLPPSKQSILSPLRPQMLLEVSMEARSADHTVLARTVCEANFQAKVVHLSTVILAPITAGSASKDVRVALVSRP
jgi:hypothetical protein